MTAYRNTRVNVKRPRTQLDYTAAAVLDALNGPNTGTVVYAKTVRAAIVARTGADVRLTAMAVRGLRNLGYAIIANKARHLSWYKLAGTPVEYEEHRRRVVSEMYSCMLGHCRELAGAVSAQPTDLSLDASLKHAQMLAISLGTDTAVGKTIPEVVAELAPLP